MSFNDAFHDYINDIPMNMSRKFYPTPNISVDLIQIPDRIQFSKFEYTFEAESRAREQFDKQNEPIVLESTSSGTSSSGTATHSEAVPTRSAQSDSGALFNVLSQDVLVPCPVNSAPVMSMKPLTPNTVSLPHSLHEFESINNVFDDVHISALDDRKVLQEVLMSTAPNTKSSSSSPLFFNNSINNNPEKAESVPPQPPQHQLKPRKEKNRDHEDLRKRLLTKGYRQDIVEIALDGLPKSRLVHIEYYMKACRTIEKTGRSSVDEFLPFLVRCNLTDKNAILAYSEVSANLLKMGFDKDQTFEAVVAEQGDQTRVLNRLLPNS
ncbi:unnamed protein product [Caenorhabditis sp. 36 PRJEB53466]|nr:unnamed protein product [Caenorhabditis sp. 36 PRJEB53466]